MSLNLLHYDGMDHYDAQRGDKWASGSGSSSTDTPFGFGRSNETHTNASDSYVSIADNQAVLFSGHFKSGSSFVDVDILEISDGAPSSSNTHVKLRLHNGGKWQIRRGSNVLVETSAIASTSTWYHVAVAVHVDDTAGRIHLWIDGELVAFANGINTKNTANPTANAVGIASGGATGAKWDDIAIWAGSSYTVSTETVGELGANGDFPGVTRVVTTWPTGAGSSTQWTPDSGDNYARVNETLVDDDTSYVSSTTEGHIDLYAHGDLPFSPDSILAVQVVNIARLDGAGSGQIKPMIRSGGTNYEGGSKTLSATYLTKLHIWEQNPNGPAAWTKTAFDATEIGVNLEAYTA